MPKAREPIGPGQVIAKALVQQQGMRKTMETSATTEYLEGCWVEGTE